MVANLLQVFFWKNIRYVKFYWTSVAFILFGCLAILFTYFCVTYNTFSSPQVIYEPKNTEILKSYFSAENDDVIFYSPSNTFLDGLMENVRTELSLQSNKLQPFDTADDMILALEDKKSSNSFAVAFHEYPANESDSTALKYSISSTSLKVSPKEVYFNDKDVVGIKDQDDYQRTGFFTLQFVIDSNFIKLSTGKAPNFEILIEPLPSIALETLDSQRVITFGSFFVVFLNVVLLTTFLVPLVEEKHDGIKEFLVLATAYNYLNGLTFYMVRFAIYFVFTIVALIIGCIFKALGIIPFLYIIMVFLLFVCSNMCYAFLISVCFNSVFYAKVGGFVLLIVPYIFFLVEGRFSHYVTYIFSTKTFMEAMKVFQIFTNKHREFDRGSMSVHITNSSFSIKELIVMLAVQAICYSVIYLYLSFVFPGKGGLKRPFYFFLDWNFYKSGNCKCNGEFELNVNGSNSAIRIRNLVKVMPRGCSQESKLVVNDLNMDIENNRITVLLGHNGAGKTTTINMIIGSMPKTSGDIVVCNESDVAAYRHAIGYCPQHSVFMHYMTCFEHLKFFAQLRGVEESEAEVIAKNLLKQLNLQHKANVPGKNLSGGMKRRLSLGMAIAGDTKIIILDEPSSGLDVESRRELWNILLELRKTKAILVTTHHMEEAEVLGDRISIMSHGKLIRTGTSLELKRAYGCGYVLKLLTDGHFDQTRTMTMIRALIPTAQLKNCVYPTFCITLPYQYTGQYVDVLRSLEDNAQALGITSISVTDTSLEDVFLNCETSDEIDSPSRQDAKITIPYKRVRENTFPNIDAKMLAHQSYAVFYKKFVYIRHEWAYFLFMFCIPFITIAIALALVQSQDLLTDEDSLHLNLHHAGPSEIYIRASAEFEEIKKILETEIKRFNATPIFINPIFTLEEELINVQSKNLSQFYDKVIGGLDFDSQIAQNTKTIKVLFSGNLIHSSVIMLNLVDSVLLKLNGDESDIIEATYLPIKRIADISPNRLEYYAGIVPIGLFFYMLFYVSLPFKEEKTKFKCLQAMPRFTYWVSFTFFDVCLHSLTCCLIFVFHKAIISDNLYSNSELAWLTTTYMFYGFSYLPILYVMASSFRSMSTLSTYLFFMLIISCTVPLLTSGNQQSMSRYEEVITFMSFLPDFSLNHQLRVINENFFIQRRNELVKSTSHTVNFSRQQSPLLNMMTFYFYAVFVLVIVELFLIFVWENINRRERLKDMLQLRCFARGAALDQALHDEEEVLCEKERVHEIIRENDTSDYPLLVQNLHKKYRQEHAVRGLNFAVKKGECFGLLGVNGAGKTTTFQMMTVNEKITAGYVLIDGVNILKNENLYKYRFGYCPQGDCLNNFMTSYEILKYMALLRGTSLSRVHNEVMKWLLQLDLLKYENVPIKFYSGGTKRKLNTAIAMIGDPSLVLLDEPTTGVDPISRRFMWKCIQDFQKDNKTIVLTSHSMDECEYLCNRLAIMAKGQFQCIGFIPALKANYGSGFTINFRVNENCTEEKISHLHDDLSNLFDCELREQHAGMMTYFVKETSIKWSNVFSKLQNFYINNSEVLEEYSVNETTLEDIFLKFDKKFKSIETSEL